jgi:hypothetical protein
VAAKVDAAVMAGVAAMADVVHCAGAVAMADEAVHDGHMALHNRACMACAYNTYDWPYLVFYKRGACVVAPELLHCCR